MSSTLNAALINNANLEKQLFLERESKAEFQKAVKREVVSMKKKAFVTEKRIADSQLAMKRALAECKKILSALDAPGLAKMSSNRGLQEIRSSAEAMSLSISEALGTAVLQKTASSLGYVASASDVSAGGEEEASPRFGPSSPMDMPVPQLESGISDMVIDEGEEDDWQMEGRSASSEQIEVLLKEVYVMMCGSSNNADANSKDDKKKDTSLESFMTLDEFLKFATIANMIDDHLALPKIEELFMKTVRSSSRGAKKFSKRIQFDDFRVALAEMAEIKFPYNTGVPPLDTLLTDYVWPMRSRMAIKKELGNIMQSHFENAFFKGEVMTFMTAQNDALMKIFKRYALAMSSSSSLAGGGGGSSDMAIDQLCQFAIDYNVTPNLINQDGLMQVIRDIVGRKFKVTFTEFLRVLGKLAEVIYVDEVTYPSLLAKVEAMFHEIDRGGSIFNLSAKRKQAEKARRTSTIGKLQSVSSYKSTAGAAKGAGLDSEAKEKRLSTLNGKRMSNVNKMFMLK